jgi:hypothetical protein
VIIRLFVDRRGGRRIVGVARHSTEYYRKRCGNRLLRRCRINPELLADRIDRFRSELLLDGL